MNHYSNVQVKVLTPVQWLKTPISEPAYYWLFGFATISIISFSNGYLFNKFINYKEKK